MYVEGFHIELVLVTFLSGTLIKVIYLMIIFMGENRLRIAKAGRGKQIIQVESGRCTYICAVCGRPVVNSSIYIQVNVKRFSF